MVIGKVRQTSSRDGPKETIPSILVDALGSIYPLGKFDIDDSFSFFFL